MFGDAPNPGRQDQFVADIAGHSLVGLEGLAREQEITGCGNTYKVVCFYVVRYPGNGFIAHESIQPGILVENFFHEIEFSRSETIDRWDMAGMRQGIVKTKQGEITMPDRQLKTGKAFG